MEKLKTKKKLKTICPRCHGNGFIKFSRFDDKDIDTTYVCNSCGGSGHSGKQNNQGKIFIAKNRNGPDGMIYDIFMDPSNASIKVMPKTTTASGVVPMNPVALTAPAQKNLLQNKYEKYRKRK